MKILVAGGSGFLGRLVIPALRGAGHEVTVISRGRRPLVGLRHVNGDVATGAFPDEAFDGVDAVVNLVGIKHATPDQGFEAAHVDGTRHLLAAASRFGVRRFVHVSVVASRPDPSLPYHDTKWRGEELVRASDRDWTVLRPGVIWGPGDDLLGHLVKMIRTAPVFPVVGRGKSPMQPVHGADVADAIVAALEQETSVGRTYDLVGPETLPLREVVRRVATATQLPTWIVSTPVWVHRVAVWLMAFLPRPLATPAQLRMLRDGLVGEASAARSDLQFSPRPFAVDDLARLAGWIPPLLGISLRPSGGVPGAGLSAFAKESSRAWILVALALPFFLVVQALVDHPWWQLLLWDLGLILASLLAIRLPWRRLLRPTAGRVLRGAIAAALLYGVAWIGFLVLVKLVPAVSDQKDVMMGWREGLPLWLAAVMLPIIVFGEELFWRGTVNLSLGGRFGAMTGVLLSAALFAGVHLAMGPPLLWLAALVAGAFWAGMASCSSELVSPYVAHVLWDAAVIFWWPLGVS